MGTTFTRPAEVREHRLGGLLEVRWCAVWVVPRQHDLFGREAERSAQLTIAGELEVDEIGAGIPGALDKCPAVAGIGGAPTPLGGGAQSQQYRKRTGGNRRLQIQVRQEIDPNLHCPGTLGRMAEGRHRIGGGLGRQRDDRLHDRR